MQVQFSVSARVRAFLCVLVAATVIPARADSISNYGIFADDMVFINGGLNTFIAPAGLIGSNGDLFFSSGNFGNVRAGGNLYAFSSGPKFTGDIVVNRDVALGTFSEVVGNIHAGGDAQLRTAVTGNITVGGTVQSREDVTGSIISGGTATIEGNVGGNVSAGGNIILHSTISGNATYGPGKTLHYEGGTVNGSVGQAPVSPTPASFTPVSLPNARVFGHGNNDLFYDTFDDANLTPGHYGELTLTGSNDLNFTAGDYYFESITMINSFARFHFDTTGGPINIFVTDSVSLNSPSMTLNGVSFSNIDPSLAGQVYWEVHDNFRANFADILGTVYTPFGDIQLTQLSKATGTLISGHQIISDGLNFVRGATSDALLVPEPGTLILAALAGLALSFQGVRQTRTRREKLVATQSA